uniref:Uncharacterized protein n=1 Tax=Ciona savignyi TaxID=51511 RepID=H2ZKQ0_CIOSA
MCCSDQSPLWLFNTDNLRAEGKEIENWNFNLDRKKLVRPRRYVIPLDIPSDASQGSNLVTIRGYKATAILCVDGSVSLEHELLIPDDIAGTNAAIELPRINYDYNNGRKYNYMYGVQGANFLPDQLVKINVEKKELLEWGETDKFPSEPVFVPRPDATEEDDGIILSTVISKCPEDKTFLLILDASTFKEIARAEVDAKLSYPLHGNFYEHA